MGKINTVEELVDFAIEHGQHVSVPLQVKLLSKAKREDIKREDLRVS